MEHRTIAILLLSLMLSMLVMPLAIAIEDSKSVIKGMVQSPADYSVGLKPWDYRIWALTGRLFLDYDRAYDRIEVYYPPNWVFWRLGAHP